MSITYFYCTCDIFILYTHTFLFLVPVTIQLFTKNTTVTEGNPINLTCHANGFPVPSVVWKKDGQEISSMSVLHIESSQRSDSGRYICIASNTLQKKEMETFVTVNCK